MAVNPIPPLQFPPYAFARRLHALDAPSPVLENE